MTVDNILDIGTRSEFRNWLIAHSATEKECWVAVGRGKSAPEGVLWYIDAVEEALCFGWIDSTLKNVGGVALQRFGPRAKSSRWTELNKERCRRLEKLGLMTEQGRAVCPDLEAGFEIAPDVREAFAGFDAAWRNFQAFPELYKRVRVDNIQRVRSCKELFDSRLAKLIAASGRNEMIGEGNDYGRLLNY
ncbi:MAG: YdeI/OmpD-associated family protein [Muribaculaceae bacterium]|nr:YdeI/OmpD-associated family protein [Muribaculaceae bacterium]